MSIKFIFLAYFISNKNNDDVSASLSPNVVDPFICLLKAKNGSITKQNFEISQKFLN